MVPHGAPAPQSEEDVRAQSVWAAVDAWQRRPARRLTGRDSAARSWRSSTSTWRLPSVPRCRTLPGRAGSGRASLEAVAARFLRSRRRSPQSLSSFLGGDVALGLGEGLVAEAMSLANGHRPEAGVDRSAGAGGSTRATGHRSWVPDGCPSSMGTACRAARRGRRRAFRTATRPSNEGGCSKRVGVSGVSIASPAESMRVTTRKRSS
jgi:hypothetical protein